MAEGKKRRTGNWTNEFQISESWQEPKDGDSGAMAESDRQEHPKADEGSPDTAYLAGFRGVPSRTG